MMLEELEEIEPIPPLRTLLPEGEEAAQAWLDEWLQEIEADPTIPQESGRRLVQWCKRLVAAEYWWLNPDNERQAEEWARQKLAADRALDQYTHWRLGRYRVRRLPQRAQRAWWTFIDHMRYGWHILHPLLVMAQDRKEHAASAVRLSVADEYVGLCNEIGASVPSKTGRRPSFPDVYGQAKEIHRDLMLLAKAAPHPDSPDDMLALTVRTAQAFDHWYAELPEAVEPVGAWMGADMWREEDD